MRTVSASLVSLATLLVVGCSGSASSGGPQRPKGVDELYSAEVNEKAATGKDLIMRFDEVERRAGASVVRVWHQAGASVPSVMFVVKGCYEMAKLRGAKYFVNIKEWRDEQGNWMYVVAFTSTKNVDLKRLYGDDCQAAITEDSFMSVEAYDLLWGDRH